MSVHNKVDNYCTVENRKKSHGLLNDVDNQIAGCESPAPQSIHQRSGIAGHYWESFLCTLQARILCKSLFLKFAP